MADAARLRGVEGWQGIGPEDPDRPAGEMRSLIGDLVRPHRWRLAAASVLLLVRTACTLLVPYLIGRAIDTGIRAGGTGALALYVASISLAALGSAAASWGFLRTVGESAQDVLHELRLRVFAHVQDLSVAFYERLAPGGVVARMTGDIDALNDLLTTGVNAIVGAVVSIALTAAVLLLLDLRLGILGLLAVPPVIALTRWYRAGSARAYRAVRRSVAMVVAFYSESLSGMRAVQAYGAERRNQQIFDHLSGQYRDASAQAVRMFSIFGPCVAFTGWIVTVVVLVAGGALVVRRQVTLGTLVAFIFYLQQFFEPMPNLSQFFSMLQAAGAAFERIAAVLREEPALAPAAPRSGLGRGPGELRFDHVTFGYREGAPVLCDLTLEVRAGETVALVGRTGAGKTTIARLAARFYDPDAGGVRLDGVDLRDIAEPDLRRAVVLVTQERFLFSGSVAENIAFGRPGASLADVEAAARAVGADAFVRELPGGYDTDVGSRGTRLSAGQRQLIAFARAFAAGPRVLVLDEATASLDAPSERFVLGALRTLLAGRTAIIIAHRLATVEVADRAVVVEGGAIVEEGPPEALLGTGGPFDRLRAEWLRPL